MSGRRKIPDYAAIMAQCVEKAQERAGFTKTNPLVGAAVVKNGKVVSYGVHEFFGGPHAEVNALNSAGEVAKGADLVVTLEPCSTYGKTPACTDKIISSGIKNVYVGVVDPNPSHLGRGIGKLREASINVHLGIEAEKCALLIEDFTKSILYKRPYVSVKTAMSADGRIATKSGDSKWITSESSRQYVHKMRGTSGAVLTGIGTVLADNPLLTDRRSEADRQPIRVVLDSFARTPLSSNLVKTARDIPLIIFVSENASVEKIKQLRGCGVDVISSPCYGSMIDIDFVLKSLYEKDIMKIMVEAGATVTGSFRDFNAADAFDIFIAPKLIGGARALSPVGGSGAEMLKDAVEFVSMDAVKCGSDIYIKAKIKDYTTQILENTYKLSERA